MDAVASRRIRVLVATKAERVFEILDVRDDVSYDIALHSGSISERLAGVQLVIIDDDDVVPYPMILRELHDAIFEARVLECRSDEFVAKPDDYLGGLAMNKPGIMLSLPKNYCIAFVAYSGGTGRTTLALDTAFRYAATVNGEGKRRRKRDVDVPQELSPLLVEMTFGVSSLISLTGVEMPSLMELATSADSTTQQYKGVDMVPMDYENVRVLSAELLERYFRREKAKHSLTVLEGIWPHSQAEAVANLVDLWIVVANERPDTIQNAQRLYEELSGRFKENVWLLQNQVKNLDESANKGIKWDIRVPLAQRPEEYKGELGQVVLSRVFAPIWRGYAKPK
jgi:hypothetical protein